MCFCGNKYGKHGTSDKCKCDNSSSIGEKLNCVYQVADENYYQVPAQFPYVGCYKDTTDRDLAAEKGVVSSAAACQQKCNAANFMFFSLQSTMLCFCGNSYGKHGASDQCQCNSRDIGEGLNCVYQVKKPQNKGASYVGCYKDTLNRDLSVYKGQLGGLAQCQQACAATGYLYFSLQAEMYCFCGNSYGKYGKSDKCTCDSFTTGNWLNCVYQVQDEQLEYHKTANYIGCYKDAADRDLSIYKGQVAGLTDCRQTCTAEGYLYFSLQSTAHCFCGNSYGKHGVSNQCKCESYDVGPWLNCVYQVDTEWNQALKYEGCYSDSATRDMPVLRQPPLKAATTGHIHGCAQACQGFKYSVLAYQNQCFCGDAVDTFAGSNTCSCDSDLTNCVYSDQTVDWSGIKYLGCYHDKADRDLTVHKGVLSKEQCRAECSAYKYFGLQFASHCFCGDSYGKYGAKSSCRCTSGISDGWSNCVYEDQKKSSHEVTTPMGAKFLGCYKDAADRDLPVAKDKVGSVSECKARCDAENYLFFSLQSTWWCFCGNSYGKHGKSDQCKCDDLVDIGDWVNCVYQVEDKWNQAVKYEGCFTDDVESPDLEVLKGTFVKAGSHIRGCAEACKGFKYFGQQGEHQCSCSNSFGSYGKSEMCTCEASNQGEGVNCVYSDQTIAG